MKIVRFQHLEQVQYGILEGDQIQVLEGSPYETISPIDKYLSFSQVKILCPVSNPRIFGVGLNYIEHIEESGSSTPVIPLLFMKPSTTAIGMGEDIIYPREANNLHFEAELAVVIGKRARRIRKEDALDSVLGYTCANDISERVIQSSEMAMGSLLIGKGYDTFCPLGPVIATNLDPTALKIGARVNGQERQASSTSDLLFSVAYLIEYMSRAITFLPGDVIITGTPSGVGPIVPGDSIEIYVEGVGVLSNKVVAEK